MQRTSLPVWQMSHTILQYSNEGSAAQVHNDLHNEVTGMNASAPWLLVLLKTSNSISEGRAITGPWSITNTVFKLFGQDILKDCFPTTCLYSRMKCLYGIVNEWNERNRDETLKNSQTTSKIRISTSKNGPAVGCYLLAVGCEPPLWLWNNFSRRKLHKIRKNKQR